MQHNEMIITNEFILLHVNKIYLVCRGQKWRVEIAIYTKLRFINAGFYPFSL